MSLHTGINNWQFDDNVLFELWRKSDTELKIIMNKSASKVLVSMGDLGFEEEKDAKAKFAAAEYIMNMKPKQEEEKNRINTARIKTKKKLLIRLKAAHTPNAQLVVAILEDEDGKTKEELASWCDELSALDDSVLETLLDDLSEDDVIYKGSDNRYYLNRICNENLDFPNKTTFKNWAYRIIQNYDERYRRDSDLLEVGYGPTLGVVYSAGNMGLLMGQSGVFYFEDTLRYIDGYNSRHQKNLSESIVQLKIKQFVKLGILRHSTDRYDTEYFWIPKLGERSLKTQKTKAVQK